MGKQKHGQRYKTSNDYIGNNAWELDELKDALSKMMNDPKLQKDHPEFPDLKKHMDECEAKMKGPRERKHHKNPLSPGQTLDD